MSMSDHIKQQLVEEIFAKKVSFPGKRQMWIFLFIRVGEAAHISKVCNIFRVEATWHTALNERTAPNRSQRFESRQRQSISFIFFYSGPLFFIC